MICSLVHRAFRVVKLCFSITLMFLNLTLTLNSILSIDTRPVIMEKCQHISNFLYAFVCFILYSFFFFFQKGAFSQTALSDINVRYATMQMHKGFFDFDAFITHYSLYFILFFRLLLYLYLPFNFLSLFNLSIL